MEKANHSIFSRLGLALAFGRLSNPSEQSPWYTTALSPNLKLVLGRLWSGTSHICLLRISTIRDVLDVNVDDKRCNNADQKSPIQHASCDTNLNSLAARFHAVPYSSTCRTCHSSPHPNRSPDTSHSHRHQTCNT